jgi:hypothetical protein
MSRVQLLRTPQWRGNFTELMGAPIGLVFGRFSVWLSVGALSVVTGFPLFSSVPPGKSHYRFLPNHNSFVILIFGVICTDSVIKYATTNLRTSHNCVAGWTALRMRLAGSTCRRRSTWTARTSWQRQNSCLAQSWPGGIPCGASVAYSGPSCR